MIEFKQVWLPQIVAYARLIHTGQLEDQWLGRSGLVSSVTDPDELHEQVFDDLDADGVWPPIRDAGAVPLPMAQAIDSFLSSLRVIDGNEPIEVVASPAWAMTREAAGNLLAIVR